MSRSEVNHIFGFGEVVPQTINGASSQDVLRDSTVAEEIANATLHGIGVLISIAAIALMAYWGGVNGDAVHVVSTAIFGITLLAVYLSSTLYHSFSNSRYERLLETFDHCAIYLLIAGTYTPMTLVVLGGAWGWSLFGVIWAMAVCGIAFRLLVPVDRFQALSTLFYLGMGWAGIIAIEPLIENMEVGGLWLLLAGVLSYSLGIIFYLWRRLPFSHAIWHLFVLGGSVTHFLCIFFYVIPASPI